MQKNKLTKFNNRINKNCQQDLISFYRGVFQARKKKVHDKYKFIETYRKKTGFNMGELSFLIKDLNIDINEYYENGNQKIKNHLKKLKKAINDQKPITIL